MCFQAPGQSPEKVPPVAPPLGMGQLGRRRLSAPFESPEILVGAFGPEGARILSDHPSLLPHWNVLKAFSWKFQPASQRWLGTVRDLTYQGGWVSDSPSGSLNPAKIRPCPISQGAWKIEISSRGDVHIGKIDTDPFEARLTRTRIHEAALTSMRRTGGGVEAREAPLDLQFATLRLSVTDTLTCLNFTKHLKHLTSFLTPLADFPLAGRGWLSEKFRFEMPNFEMFHHQEPKILDISASFRYRERMETLPDFRVFEREIAEFLRSYPNQIDYWEILNRKLVSLMLQRHLCIEELAITIAVHGNDSIGFERASTVAMQR